MPRLKYKPPSYCLHKASGQAVVIIGGRDHYLGLHGTAESRERYKTLIAEWATAKDELQHGSSDGVGNDLRVNELLKTYLEFATGYYRKNGKPTGELRNMRDAMKPVAMSYGRFRASEFTSRSLRAVREAMTQAQLSRGVINARVNRIRRIFKWGVENHLVHPDVLHRLQAVTPLKKGRTKARETEPVKPVPEQ